MSQTQLEFLQIELNKTQAMLGTYRQLPEKKRLKRKYFEEFKRLIKREIFLKEQIKKET